MSNDTLLITLAQPNPDHADVFHSYVEASTQLALNAGAVVSSRFGVRHIHGDAPALIFGLATFPTVESVLEMFAAPAYQALIPDRDKSIDCVNAYSVVDPPIAELDELEGDAVYLITVADPNPTAQAYLAAYQQAAGPLAVKHGAVPVARLPVVGHPVGDTPASFVAIARYPSADAVDDFLTDPDYLDVVDVRNRALRSLNLYVSTH